MKAFISLLRLGSQPAEERVLLFPTLARKVRAVAINMSSSRSPEPNEPGKKWHGHITNVAKCVDDQRAKAINTLIEGFSRWYRVEVKPALLETRRA